MSSQGVATPVERDDGTRIARGVACVLSDMTPSTSRLHPSQSKPLLLVLFSRTLHPGTQGQPSHPAAQLACLAPTLQHSAPPVRTTLFCHPLPSVVYRSETPLAACLHNPTHEKALHQAANQSPPPQCTHPETAAAPQTVSPQSQTNVLETSSSLRPLGNISGE